MLYSGKNCVGFLDEFVAIKKGTSLKIAESILIKARDPFLKIRKKIDSMVNIEAMKQTTLTIIGGEYEEPSALITQ